MRLVSKIVCKRSGNLQNDDEGVYSHVYFFFTLILSDFNDQIQNDSSGIKQSFFKFKAIAEKSKFIRNRLKTISRF